MRHEFKIGDKVMANFGQYTNNDLHVDQIIGETKTLWKCKTFSFTKEGFVRGQPTWHPVNVKPYDDEYVKKINRQERLKKEWILAKRKIDSIFPDYDLMEQVIDWVNENIKD